MAKGSPRHRIGAVDNRWQRRGSVHMGGKSWHTNGERRSGDIGGNGGNVSAWADSSAYATNRGRARSPPASTKRSTTHFQFDRRAGKEMHVTPAQFDSGRRRNAGWIGDGAMGAGGTTNTAQNGSSSVSGRGGVEPAYRSGSKLHVKHTNRTFFGKHTARKGIGFHPATMSSTKFSPSLPSPHPTGSSGGADAKTDHGLLALKISSPGTGLGVPRPGTANGDALVTGGRRTSTLIKRAEEVVGLPEEGLYEESRVHENLVWRREVSRGRGLYNGGSTCFLNATLQCLAFLPPLAQHFLEEDYEAMPASSSKTSSVGKRQQAPSRDVLVIVGNLIKQVLRGQTNKRQADAVRPTELLRNLRLVGSQYRHNVEEDAHEFMRQLLQSMGDSCLARSKSKLAASSSKAKNSLLDETTAIHRIFGGYLRSRLKCRSCGHHSDKYEQFLDLSMELPRGVTTVEGALGAFTSVEHLKGSNRWCCNVCKKLVDADKNLTIFKPPNALVVHLKRFAVQGRKLTKMKTKIGFGESLAVKVSGPEGRAVYDLTGVVQHFGEGRRSGHYVALVKTSQGKWYQADDARVFEVGRRQVALAQAYVLFYTRRRPALALAVPSPPALPPPTVLGGSGRTSSGMVRPTVNTDGSTIRVDMEDVGERVPAETSGGAPTSREASRPPSLPETTGRAGSVRPATTVNGLILVPGAGQHGGAAAAETSVADDTRAGSKGLMADGSNEGKPVDPQCYNKEKGSVVKEAKGSREGVSAQGEMGKRASSPPVCARDPVQVSKRRKLKNGNKGSAANASGHEEAFSLRGGGEATGDLPSGVARASSAADAVGGEGTTRNDNGGEGGGNSSISSRDKSSETCEVTGKRVVVPWRPTKKKSKELYAQKIDSWMDGDKDKDDSLAMDGEDLERVAFQKELQAGLSQNQAAVESKDKWSRSASFWDRSLDMGKLKKVKDKEATAPKLGENAFQAKQEELHSKSRRGHPEAVPHKMVPTNDENRRVSSGEGQKRNRGGSGGELKMGRGGGKARGKKARQ